MSSLCNVIYKLVSKVLANRLKKILPFIILKNQSTFVSGRKIIDNVLVAFELINFLHHKTQGKKHFMSIKLDMSKTYDMVEWCSLKVSWGKWFLLISGFLLIQMCISTLSYLNLVNGVLKGLIIPSRGLWQEDPLSPYLFMLCAEGLVSLLKKAKNDDCLTGIQL